jgi:hydrogenase maturation protein HypF
LGEKGLRILARGVVQGVGYRPFIYRLARDRGLTGWVLNSRDGVRIEVEGEAENIADFLDSLKQQAPPLAVVESVEAEPKVVDGFTTFEIRESLDIDGEVTLLSPDMASCDDCQQEIFDRKDRRYGYPFTNCTNCGPRLSIILDTPYDRAKTTMRSFVMCETCAREYHDPENRRFHAQPNACPVCGPSLHLVDPMGRQVAGDPIDRVVRALRDGQIIGIKGLGGYHIACDATSEATVVELRRRKDRPHKPFALMASSVPTIRRFAEVSRDEEEDLTSPQAPVVLLKKRDGDSPLQIAPSVAPHNPHLGVMLPYTPLHHLLLAQDAPPVLVMTSGNRTDEPIVADDDEALKRLAGICDLFLGHNRPIHNRTDDSILYRLPISSSSPETVTVLLRRSRGYAPSPLTLPIPVVPTLAVGPQMKNTFCLAEGYRAFMSQHIGELDNLETLNFFGEMVERFKGWFRIEPELVARDLHPDYLSTRYAESLNVSRKIAVQHHHAHIVSCMAEHGVTDPVIGLAFDGTGYGTDGTIWGCEFLVAGLDQFERKGHLKLMPLPGGESAIREPWRIAVAYLVSALGTNALTGPLPATEGVEQLALDVLVQQVDRNVNLVWTSSLGRLFDAVSALLGVCQHITFDAQAAIALEHLCHATVEPGYRFEIVQQDPFVVDPTPVLSALVNDLKRGEDRGLMASRFHGALIDAACEVAQRLHRATGIHQVVLSGGAFQNRLLLAGLMERLAAAGLDPLIHRAVPPNDGCVSLGQVVAANAIGTV